MARTMWGRDYVTGEPICDVCGAPRAGRSSCCPCAPYVDLETFWDAYFDGDRTVPRAIVREFHDDYLHSKYKSLAEYKARTTSEA